MAELNEIFADYNYSPSSLFGELISQISDLFNQVDPMGIIEKGDACQDDEYLPETDMVIWLHASKNLNKRTFWAVWEYQFADLNPYADENEESLNNLYKKVLDSLDSRWELAAL